MSVRRAFVRAVSIVVAVMALGLPPYDAGADAQSMTVDARPAGLFVDSIGLNAHLLSSYSRYGRSFAYVAELLSASGVRHVRGYDLQFGPHDPQSAAMVADLARRGIRSTAGMTADAVANQRETPEFIARAIASLAPGSIEALEAPNELDNCCHDADWAGDDVKSVKTLADAVRTEPALRGLPVIGPSLAFKDAAPLGDLSPYEQYVNLHVYYAGFMPETTGWGAASPFSNGIRYGDLRYGIENARRQCVTCKLIVTEAGYCTAPIRNCVPESVEAAWLPRLLLAHWSAGIQRTYLYELMATDERTGDGTLGLIRPDLTPKPAFRALAGLIAILGDHAAPSSCAGKFTITGALDTVRAVAFCKPGGELDLAIWTAQEQYDTNASAMRLVSSREVELSWSAVRPHPVYVWSEGEAGGWSASELASTRRLTVTESVRIVIVDGTKISLPVLPRS